jgi:hypothetical protein
MIGRPPFLIAFGVYSIFTSGAYGATAPDVAFPQEKPHFAELDCAE